MIPNEAVIAIQSGSSGGNSGHTNELADTGELPIANPMLIANPMPLMNQHPITDPNAIASFLEAFGTREATALEEINREWASYDTVYVYRLKCAVVDAFALRLSPTMKIGRSKQVWPVEHEGNIYSVTLPHLFNWAKDHGFAKAIGTLSNYITLWTTKLEEWLQLAQQEQYALTARAQSGMDPTALFLLRTLEMDTYMAKTLRDGAHVLKNAEFNSADSRITRYTYNQWVQLLSLDRFNR
jgi:hypothetical protein